VVLAVGPARVFFVVPAVSSLQEKTMPGIVIIDEKGSAIKSDAGYPHSTILLQFDSPKSLKWFGFFPVGELYGKRGVILEEDRETYIENYIRFEIPEAKLNAVVTGTVPIYRNKEYNFGVCDCVSFAADACRAVGISVPRVNITPGGFVSWLKNFKSDYTHYNNKPYPWKLPTVQPTSPYAPAVADRGKYVATVTVEPGMTLGGLCKKIYSDASGAKLSQRVDMVAKANNIPNPNLIRVGQKINFPKA
jgi:hypothetical protein